MKQKWITFEPDASLAQDMPSPDEQAFDEVFSKTKLQAGEGALPLSLLKEQDLFSKYNHYTNVNVEGFILKAAGSLTHRIPAAYAQFKEIIQLAAAFEAAHSDYFTDKVGYLTIRQTFLNKGGYQAGSSVKKFHTDYNDEVAGERCRPLVDHIYIAADHSPTRLQKQRLKDAFNELSQDPEKSFQPRPYELAFFTNYSWHRSVSVTEECCRTFVRVAYKSPSRSDLRDNLGADGYAALKIKPLKFGSGL